MIWGVYPVYDTRQAPLSAVCVTRQHKIEAIWGVIFDKFRPVRQQNRVLPIFRDMFESFQLLFYPHGRIGIFRHIGIGDATDIDNLPSDFYRIASPI